uniref:Uncharacterized protein n=1 Tax=Ciona savignyi TaxID=51511 RepID=H2YFQ8_CIOSA
MQLQRDLEHILDVACSDNFQLCRDVRRTLPFCKSMKRGMWVSKLLQRTDVPNDPKTGTKGRNPQSDDDIDYKREDVGWMIKEKEILSLRLLSKNG